MGFCYAIGLSKQLFGIMNKTVVSGNSTGASIMIVCFLFDLFVFDDMSSHRVFVYESCSSRLDRLDWPVLSWL